MPIQQQGTHAVQDMQHEGAPGQKQKRKDRVLNKDRPALVSSIDHAVVIKDEDLFFLSERDGGVPQKGNHGFGL